jgi:hypothetical protein
MKAGIVIVSDTHIDSPSGLAPLSFTLASGHTIHANDLQKYVHNKWSIFWNHIYERMAGAPWLLLHNGDVVEGVHHGSRDNMTNDMSDCQRMAVELLYEPARQADKVVIVAGTEAHAGKGHTDERAVAHALKDLGANVIYDGASSIWMHFQRAYYGVNIDATHHTSISNVPAGVPGNVARAYVDTVFELAQFSQETGAPLALPDYLVRSHTHRRADTGATFSGRALVTPPWQIKTAFGQKAAPNKVPRIGGAWIEIYEDGTHRMEMKSWPVIRERQPFAEI